MKIVAPLKDAASVPLLADRGADEFYCGVRFGAWFAKYGDSLEYNRRGNYGGEANFQNPDALAEAVDASKRRGKGISLTANALRVSSAQAAMLEPLFSDFRQMGGSAVIVSDVSLMRPAKRQGLKVTLSSCATVASVSAAKFFEALGADRIILPRDVTLDDIREIVAACPGVEFEAFVMNDPCRFCDGNCLGLHHTRFGSLCSFLDDVKKQYVYFKGMSAFPEEALRSNEADYRGLFREACGLCALYDLLACGVHAVKIAGRLCSPELIAGQITQIRNDMDAALRCGSRKEFLAKVRAGTGCEEKSRPNCYYRLT